MAQFSLFEYIQLFFGIALLYAAITGSGSSFFPEVQKEYKEKVVKTLRIIYAICGVLSFAELGVIAFADRLGIPEGTVRIVSIVSCFLLFGLIAVAMGWMARFTTDRVNRK